MQELASEMLVCWQAYFVFSVGNIKQIFPYEYPSCWKTYATCSKTMTQAPDYMQIVGIIFGMITLGYLGDKIGRECPALTSRTLVLSSLCSMQGSLHACIFKICHILCTSCVFSGSSMSVFAGKWGSVFTVSIMMVGCILLTLTGIGLDGRQMVSSTACLLHERLWPTGCSLTILPVPYGRYSLTIKYLV